jgi:L-lactate dehydrogenase
VKIAIIGAGRVGSTLAFTLLAKGVGEVLSLIDVDRERALGEVEDLRHGISFAANMDIRAEGYEGVRDAQVIVITAGRNRRPGESRLDLARSNVETLQGILGAIRPLYEGAVILVASNPVDILTQVAWRGLDAPAGRVLGSGTALDTSRFRYLLGQELGIDPRSIHASFVGEHGDSAVPVWSTATVGQVPLTAYAPLGRGPLDLEDRARILKSVLEAGKEVIRRKGATFYAIALSLCRILEAILANEHAVFTVSTPLEGFMGLSGICLSLPAVLGRTGVRELLPIQLDADEREGLLRSARVLRAALDDLGVA